MTPPVTEGDWSSPTLYRARQSVEPRLFTEADPIGSLVVADWSDDGSSGPGPTWGTTTLVGKPKPRRGPKAVVPAVVAPAPPEAHDTFADTALQPAEQLEVATEVGTDTTALEAAPETDDRSNRGLLAASGSMAVATLVSRVTGFLRTVLIAIALGIGGVGNAYNSANTFPNQVYELLLGGVLSSVLVPLLVRAQSEDDDGGVAYTQRLLSIATAALAGMTVLAVLASPLLSAAFVEAGPRRDLTTVFAYLLLPEIFFYGLGAMFMAVLNIRHSYKAGAWSPVLNNAIMIVTVAVFWILPGPATLDPSSITNAQVVVLGVGTTLGIAAQAFVLVPALRRVDFRWKWRFRARPEDAGRLREVGTIGGWVLVYVVVSQVGVSVIQRLGQSNQGFSVFTNADLLFQMPYGILVVSLLTAIMPRLSRAALREDDDAVIADLGLGARLSAIGMVPITAGLIALGAPMAVTLFAHGNVTIDGGHLIGTALAWSAFGLFPFALVMLQLRVFYAMRDGKTPALVNTAMVAVKVVLVLVSNAVFTDPETKIEWLNISTSFSYVAGAAVGHVVLTRRLGNLGFGPVVNTVVQIGLASALGGGAAYGIVVLAASALGDGTLGAAVGLVGGAIVGVAVLGLLLWRLRFPAVREALATVRGR